MQAKSARLAPDAFAATLTSTGMIAQQVAGKAVRDAVFLSTYRVQHLPHAMAAASVMSLVVVAFIPMVTARISPRRLMPMLFLASAVGLVLEWLLFQGSHHLGAIAIYIHTAVFSPIIISTFWSLINERFDPHTAKAAVAKIGGGGTLGGVLGGLAAWKASSFLTLHSSIVMIAVINLVCFASVLAIRAPVIEQTVGKKEDTPTIATSFGLLRKTPFLRNLAILVGIGALISSLFDYVLGVQAVAQIGKGPDLLAFFSIFGLAVSVLSFTIQTLLGRIAVEKVALAVHIAVLPGVVVLGSAFGLAIPGIASATVLRGAEMVHRNTLFRSAYELLYTPVPELQKRATKALIDVGFDRAGTVLGSLVTMAVIFVVAPTHAQELLLVASVALALSSLPVIRNLHRGYVFALEERLRTELVESGGPSSVDPDDPARESLIHQLAKIKPNEDDHGLARSFIASPTTLLELEAELLSPDDARARAALGRLDGQSLPAASHAILLLAHRTLHHDARLALRRLVPAITGQLVDAMLNADMDFAVRRRIPPILAIHPSQRTADGLIAALSDPRFEVRYAAGRALMSVVERGDALHLPRKQIEEIVRAEVAHEQHVASTIDEESLSDEATAPLDVVTRDRVSRALEHVFTLLAVLLGSEAVRICFRALHQDDDRHRGTALEYLQTVLPAELRDALWPSLGETGPLPSVRAPTEVLAELVKAIAISRENGTDDDDVIDAPKSRSPMFVDVVSEPLPGRVVGDAKASPSEDR